MIPIGAVCFGVVCGWLSTAVVRPARSWRYVLAVGVAGALTLVAAGGVGGVNAASYTAAGLFVGVVGHTAWRGALKRMTRHNR